MNSCEAQTGCQRLTQDGKRKFSAVVVAGGRAVLFSAHEDPNLVAIKRLNVADRSQERLHPTLTAHQFDPAVSVDGRYHCFALSATSPQLVLVIQDSKDRTEAVFRPRDSRATARNPSIAPDGSRVVFSLSDLGGHQLGSVDMRGQGLRKLTESAGLNCWPCFSPDGQRIAFGSSRDGDFQIYVMNADGSGVRRLTQGPGFNVRPSWSPDGRRIAFTSNRDGKYEVYVMNADGSRPRRVAHDSERNDYVTWHPDGKRLQIVSERAGKCDLYWIACAGFGEER
jgi:Tol biopolymer transport system component